MEGNIKFCEGEKYLYTTKNSQEIGKRKKKTVVLKLFFRVPALVLLQGSFVNVISEDNVRSNIIQIALYDGQDLCKKTEQVPGCRDRLWYPSPEDGGDGTERRGQKGTQAEQRTEKGQPEITETPKGFQEEGGRIDPCRFQMVRQTGC